MIVQKRYQGERHYINEFVQPRNASVVLLANQIAAQPGNFAQNCLKWVKSNMEYPLGQRGNMEYVDWHYTEAFRVVGKSGEVYPLEQRWAAEFWQFPAETIGMKVGDCDDLSILLCSLIRSREPGANCFVTVGVYNGLGHAWVSYNGIVFEPSPCSGDGIYPETYPYIPSYRFNEETLLK